MTRLAPRTGFDGSPVSRLARGTWLEPESIAYDRGQVRRGRAIMPDGTLRAVYAGLADTYFSIPAHARIAGRYAAGYLTTATASGLSTATDDDPAYWVFRPTWKRCPSRYPGAATLRGRAIRCDGRVNPETGRCSMDDIPGTGQHGNGFAARYWTDGAA